MTETLCRIFTWRPVFEDGEFVDWDTQLLGVNASRAAAKRSGNLWLRTGPGRDQDGVRVLIYESEFDPVERVFTGDDELWVEGQIVDGEPVWEVPR